MAKYQLRLTATCETLASELSFDGVGKQICKKTVLAVYLSILVAAVSVQRAGDGGVKSPQESGDLIIEGSSQPAKRVCLCLEARLFVSVDSLTCSGNKDNATWPLWTTGRSAGSLVSIQRNELRRVSSRFGRDSYRSPVKKVVYIRRTIEAPRTSRQISVHILRRASTAVIVVNIDHRGGHDTVLYTHAGGNAVRQALSPYRLENAGPGENQRAGDIQHAIKR